MPTTHTWLDADGNVNNSSNYSGAAVPITGDTFYIHAGNKTITTNPNTLVAVDLVDLRLDPAFTGSLGSSSIPIKFGACTGEFRINAGGASYVNLFPVSVPKLIIEDSNPAGTVLLYDGNVTTCIISGGHNIVLGALSNPTTVEVVGGRQPRPAPTVTIQYGATITSLLVCAGIVYNYAAIATIKVSGSGTVYHMGDNTLNTTAVEVKGRGRFIANAPATHTLIETWDDGLADFTQDARFKTVTNCTARGNSKIDGSRKNVTFTNAPVVRSGIVTGAASVTADSTAFP